ncbi:YheC/YheD family protein [Paenibacillus hexagrammi]|uniref:YheC/YheD family protein n=1 Tax=Paenibacillus hexagrammi TaxID=2908839 RepID=A0ABY3SS36_9BACL|nr:YheC/YheD family protein [Paenibacillus sp. YPD9-1]UJF35821.1 YheC/YheD family protein [Paenibacillus sp. YPD9-1]
MHQKVGRQSYYIQQTIPLATYKGRPFDLRVSVQRDDSGDWQVTGIVGKVAASGSHVTNVAKGGRVRTCEVLFKENGFDVERTVSAVERASLEIVRYISRRVPHLADVGLDMGVDQSGMVKFIEMNGRDQRYSFRKGGLSETFLSNL